MKEILTKNIILNNGINMPQFGLGTYKLTDQEVTKKTIIHALKTGYRLIDTADYYKNHELISAAIKESEVDRKKIFITTKVWPIDKSEEEIRSDLDRFLKELDTDYLDLVLIHWPSKNSLQIYKILEEYYNKGIFKAIGVSNFQIEQLKELLENTSIVPVINQIELHPYLSLTKLRNFCKDNNIQIMAWKSLMNGLANEDDFLQELAISHNATPSQICLKWALQQNVIVIPKTSSEKRVEENCCVDHVQLTEDEIDQINELGSEMRLGPASIE